MNASLVDFVGVILVVCFFPSFYCCYCLCKVFKFRKHRRLQQEALRRAHLGRVNNFPVRGPRIINRQTIPLSAPQFDDEPQEQTITPVEVHAEPQRIDENSFVPENFSADYDLERNENLISSKPKQIVNSKDLPPTYEECLEFLERSQKC